MTVRLCVVIAEDTTESAMGAMRRAAGVADLVEVRADYIGDLDVGRLLENKACPVIFTLRSAQEGGRYRGTEETRLETLVEAARLGADYVDVEYSADWKRVALGIGKERIILSYHNFDETPENLESIFEEMAPTGAGILKIATRARCLADCARICGVLRSASARHLHLIALGMGRPGIPSRILGPGWGSWLTFASLTGRNATAEGQFPVDELLGSFRIRAIGAATRIYGVLGNPLGHSLSPLLHNTAFALRGIDAVYLPLEATSVEDFRCFLETVEVRGCSVTIPFKEQVRALARTCSPVVESIGAINTLVRREAGWHGENTDVEGFLRPLAGRMTLDQSNVVVLGTGGAAHAVVYGLSARGASVCVVGRNMEKARTLAERFHATYLPWSDLPNLRWDLLVNATPVGMKPRVDESPVAPECLTGEWVYDLVYNPARTRLLEEAQERGCRTIEGSEMFLAQALLQQQLWLGEQGPEDAMRATLHAALERTGSAM